MMTKDEEVDFIMKIIDHPAGFDLDLFALLAIRSHCDGYEVSWEEPYLLTKTIMRHINFTDLKEASQFFVHKRYELELGFDIEERLMKEKNE